MQLALSLLLYAITVTEITIIESSVSRVIMSLINAFTKTTLRCLYHKW